MGHHLQGREGATRHEARKQAPPAPVMPAGIAELLGPQGWLRKAGTNSVTTSSGVRSPPCSTTSSSTRFPPGQSTRSGEPGPHRAGTPLKFFFGVPVRASWTPTEQMSSIFRLSNTVFGELKQRGLPTDA